MESCISSCFSPIASPAIVYEGEGLIVAAKPAGMHCAPASQPGTLSAWLYALRPELSAVRGRRSGEGGRLHRLDAATSGLVAFAVDDAAFASVMAASTALGFEKRYRALARPGLGGLAGSRPLLRPPSGVSEPDWVSLLRRGSLERIAELLRGASIRSRFRPFGPGSARVACAEPEASLGSRKDWGRDVYESRVEEARAAGGELILELSLRRGFRHQLRAHMAWHGLALVGDALYGDSFDYNGVDYNGVDYNGVVGPEGSNGSAPPAGLCLRATRLSLPSPRGSGRLEISLP